MLFFILGYIFIAAGSVCFALGTIFNYLGAAKETDLVEYNDEDETIIEETEETK